MINFYDEFLDYLPQKVRNSSDFQKILKIFSKMIEEANDISEDVIQVKLVDDLYKKFLENKEQRYLDTRTTILKTALNEMFWTLNDANQSVVLYNKLRDLYKRLGYNTLSIDMIKKMGDVLTGENIIANKSFNYNKGKYSGYLYIFDLVEKAQIQGFNVGGFLKLLEGTESDPKQPFTYRVETSLFRETYEQTVHPMVHPIGFGYFIRTVLEFIFEDYFSSKEEKTLLEAKIRCLQPDGSYTELDLLKEYDLESFKEEKQGELKRFWVIVRDKITKERIKFVSDYDNSVKSYSLDNLEVTNIELVNSGEGILTINTKDNKVIDIDYNQYFINRKKFVEIKFNIDGDLDKKLYKTYIPIQPDDLKKVPGKNYLTAIKITPDDLFKYSLDEINGKTIKEYDRNCGFIYKIKTEYITTIKDQIWFEKDIHHDDWFSRRNKCSAFDFFVDRLEDWGKNPPEISIPYIAQTGLYVGMSKADCDCVTYYVGLAHDECKNNKWMPVIDEYYVGQKSKRYNPDYYNQPLPEINDMNKYTDYWIYEQPVYDKIVSKTEVKSTKYEEGLEYKPAFEALYSSLELNELKDYFDNPKEEFSISKEIPFEFEDTIRKFNSNLNYYISSIIEDNYNKIEEEFNIEDIKTIIPPTNNRKKAKLKKR